MSTGNSSGTGGGVNPVAIVIGLVVLAAIVYVIYHFTFAPKPSQVSASNQPAYTRGRGSAGYNAMSGMHPHPQPAGQ